VSGCLHNWLFSWPVRKEPIILVSGCHHVGKKRSTNSNKYIDSVKKKNW